MHPSSGASKPAILIRDHGRYLRLAWFFRPVLANVAAFCMQTAEDARRIADIGAAPGRGAPERPGSEGGAVGGHVDAGVADLHVVDGLGVPVLVARRGKPEQVTLAD